MGDPRRRDLHIEGVQLDADESPLLQQRRRPGAARAAGRVEDDAPRRTAEPYQPVHQVEGLDGRVRVPGGRLRLAAVRAREEPYVLLRHVLASGVPLAP